MTGPVGFDDLPRMVGTTIQGEPFELSQAELSGFEKATWLDRAYPAEDGVYDDDMIEGFLLLGMLDAVLRFTGQMDPVDSWGYNYGVDKVRFVTMVHVGDRLIPTFEVREVVPKGEAFKVLRRCTFTFEGDERIAMVADWWVYVMRRGDGQTRSRSAET